MQWVIQVVRGEAEDMSFICLQGGGGRDDQESREVRLPRPAMWCKQSRSETVETW